MRLDCRRRRGGGGPQWRKGGGWWPSCLCSVGGMPSMDDGAHDRAPAPMQSCSLYRMGGGRPRRSWTEADGGAAPRCRRQRPATVSHAVRPAAVASEGGPPRPEVGRPAGLLRSGGAHSPWPTTAADQPGRRRARAADSLQSETRCTRTNGAVVPRHCRQLLLQPAPRGAAAHLAPK